MKKFVVENRIWDKAETLPRSELTALQGAKLRETVERVQNIPFYKEAFSKTGITPEKIQSLEDLQRLPFTTKADLREQYPLRMLAVDRADVARYHGSSGTTGTPTMVAYTQNDLKVWANLCARFLTGGGLLPEHTVQIAFGYGLFTGGFGLHYGIERVGAGIIPAAAGNTPKQIMLMMDMQVDALICTPSYALTISEFILQNDIPRSALNLKYAHFGGEPWTEDMRNRIEDEMGILCFNNYGLSEVIGPGVSGECAVRDGMHISEDIIKGVNVYPTQVEQALLRVEGTAPHYLIEVDRPDRKDIATVKVEMTPESFSSSMKELQELKGKIDRAIQGTTGLRMNIELVSPNSLERFVGKAQRVVDRRPKV